MPAFFFLNKAQYDLKNMYDELTIIYRDEHLIAINKPSGLLVHRSDIDRHETRFALQLLRDQIGQHVFPVHRLDKPTSGVLLFALHAECAQRLGAIFNAHQLTKTYLAVVRGIAPSQACIDHPLTEEQDRISDKKANRQKPAQEAITDLKTIAQIELPIAVDKYPCSRYSLVECTPRTGRKHQIRRHLKHISHPIIGDAKHGKSRHNRFFQEHYNCHRLMLAAVELRFHHPYQKNAAPLLLTAQVDHCFQHVIDAFSWNEQVPKRWLHRNQPHAPR